MAAGSLFERLSCRPAGPATDIGRQRAGVLRNLQRILGTRQGAAAAHPKFGMPAPQTLLVGWPECSAQLHHALITGIQRYEPRLRAVRLTPLPATDGPGYVLAAELVGVLGQASPGQTPPGHSPATFTCIIRLAPSGRLGLTT